MKNLSSSRVRDSYQTVGITLALLGDFVMIVLADVAAFALRFETSLACPPPRNFFAYLQIAGFVIAIRLSSYYIFGLYHNVKTKTGFDILVASAKANLFAMLCITAVAFYSRALAYPRSVIIISSGLIFLAIILWRIFIKELFRLSFGKASMGSSVAIVGIDQDAQRLALHINRDGRFHYQILGFINPENSEIQEWHGHHPLLGNWDRILEVVDERKIQEVIIATGGIPRPQLFVTIAQLIEKGVSCKVLPHIYDAVVGNLMKDPDGATFTPFIIPLEDRFDWYRGFKRILDVTLSLVVLICAAPVMLATAIAVKLSSPGPILFRQERVGLWGRRFMLYKFRTMCIDAEKDGPVWASENDPRITPVGRFLRRVRFDELPQLINVLKNEMSWIGPRPERAYFVDQLMEVIPFYIERLTVKPGITGWAQIMSPYADSVETSKEKFINDIFYIKNMSLVRDCYILLKTIWVILQEKGAH